MGSERHENGRAPARPEPFPSSYGRPLTDTFVSVATVVAAPLWLVTASPTYTVAFIEMIALPITVQVEPSGDR